MKKLKTTIILFGDIIILYGALLLTLVLRYGPDYFRESLIAHLKSFSLIFIIWIIIFYLSDLYKDKYFRISPEAIQVFVLSIVISATASIILFYLFPNFFKLTPKTNLAIFSVIFGILDLSWRFILTKIYISSGWRNRVLIIGDSSSILETAVYLKHNPQIGYDIVAQIKEYSTAKAKQEIGQIVVNNQVNTVVIQHRLKEDPEIIKAVYQLLSSKITILDFVAFYEMIFQKLPLEELKESWLIEKIVAYRHFYDTVKRIIDICLSFSLEIIFLPINFIIAVLIKLSSKGPIIYKQERVGLNNKPFILYKFRTMYVDKSGPLWTTKNDKRLTLIGKFLRRSHLDEMPQLYNILKGDISFIGPRPERKELAELYQQLPYYEIRHIIKPGLTGWAQLNYKPSASIEEAKEKLQYDIYYIKNRSLVLDLLILLKTIRYIFTSHD